MRCEFDRCELGASTILSFTEQQLQYPLRFLARKALGPPQVSFRGCQLLHLVRRDSDR